MNSSIILVMSVYVVLIVLLFWIAFCDHERKRPAMTGVVNDVFEDVDYTYYCVIDETNKSHTIKKKGKAIYSVGDLVKLKSNPRIDFLEYKEEVLADEHTDA